MKERLSLSGVDPAGRHLLVYLVRVGRKHGLEMSSVGFGEYDAESSRTNHRRSTVRDRDNDKRPNAGPHLRHRPGIISSAGGLE